MIFLASQSPRRKQLLEERGYDFLIIPSGHHEIIHSNLSAEDNALWNALLKCSRARAKASKGIVMAADTLIDFKRRIIIKPVDRQDAERMLRGFAGRTHVVITAVALRDLATGRFRTFLVRSRVTFKKLSSARIADYLRTGEYKDKAGAYGYQGEGNRLVARVRGSRTNVIGLPMERLAAELKRLRLKSKSRQLLG